RTDLPTSDLQIHLDRFLALPPEEQRSHFSVKRDGRIIGTVRLGPAEISGFSMDPTSREEAATALLKSMDLLRAGGATSIIAHFEDIYESAFESLGFRRVFARMRMEAPTKPLVAELGVAKDRRGRGLGRALLETAMGRLAGREEPRLALYVTVGNDPAIALYRSMDFSQAGGQSVTARLEG